MVWFLQEHYVAAALILPEVSFVFAIWMKHYAWAAGCAAVLLAKKVLESRGFWLAMLKLSKTGDEQAIGRVVRNLEPSRRADRPK